MSDRLRFVPHPDDRGIDEILFCGAIPESYEDAARSAFARLGLRERYKTSGLSGDEWRFSTVLQVRGRPTDPWTDISTGYRDLPTHAAYLYAELFGDFREGEKNQWLYRRRVAAVAFSWKRLPVWSATYDGEAVDFLVACGHLPAAISMAGEQGAHPRNDALCCQPGCAEPAVSVYRRKAEWCRRCGSKREPIPNHDYHRAFCGAHLRRGDCGLDDADANYEAVSGPGPDGREPDPGVVSESVFGGVIDL